MPNELENVEPLVIDVADHRGDSGNFSRLEESSVTTSLQETTTIKTSQNSTPLTIQFI